MCLLGSIWAVTSGTNETELSPSVEREDVQRILKITGKGYWINAALLDPKGYWINAALLDPKGYWINAALLDPKGYWINAALLDPKDEVTTMLLKVG